MEAQAIKLFDPSCYDTHNLQEQLAMCSGVTGKLRNIVKEYLVANGIYTLDDVTKEVRQDYRNYIDQMKNTKTQKKYYKSLLEQVLLAYYMPRYPELEKQVNEVVGERAIKNKILYILMEQGIDCISKIDYETRSMYEMYLKETVAPSKVYEYLKALDKLKLKSIETENANNPLISKKLEYKDKKVFLLYHPDYLIGRTFYYIRDKEELVYDFSISTSVKMKKQIFHMLNYVLDEKKDWHDRRERFVIPLKRFYLFCVQWEIKDIEQITEKQVTAFRESMEGKVGTKTDTYMQIVDNICKYLFVTAKEINWDANSWYLERFHFDIGRTNPARTIKKFTFGQIEKENNRNFFKRYMRYEIGITAKPSLQTIRCQFYAINQFMKYCDENDLSVNEISAEEMENYITKINSKNIHAESFNRLLISVARFYNYLISKEIIEKEPVQFGYYLKIVIEKHNDRAVLEVNQKEILKALKDIPHHLRLMYLNLWAIGLRVNEVCAIKGNSYYWDGKDAWICIYQSKVRTEKYVPIPKMLYEQMMEYIRQNNIGADEYVFQNKRGGAYDAGTFCKQIKRCLKEAGIANYSFKSHDFRHTVATNLYLQGVSIEVIRDYLGHKDSNMTKKYLDYMNNELDKANEDYFALEDNKLGVIQKKERNK